jgi:heptosyltransferase-3
VPLGRPRILVSRTDRIGDVVLTLPLCAMLRARLGAEIVFLGRAYTLAVLEASPAVDRVLDWDAIPADAAARRDALRAAGADVVIHAFPRPEIAAAARAAGIPTRIGTSHRLYHWLTCNALEHFSRRRSPLHEAQLNVRLARRLLGEVPPLDALRAFVGLVPRATLPPVAEEALRADRVNVVLHPKSRGSGREWPLDRWRALAEALDPRTHRLVVSGSGEERALLGDWVSTLPSHVVDLTGRLTLPGLIAFLARVDGLVAAGTGPLHLAAAAGAHALGLFPPTPPIHPGRWAPLGPRAEWLAADEPCAGCRIGGEPCTCMEGISVESVLDRVTRWTPRPPQGASAGS